MGDLNVISFPFRIGRDSELSLCLLDRTVSKIHAELTIEDEQLYVRDLSSTNGTFLNGDRVEREAKLSDGDLLRLADVMFRVGSRREGEVDHTVAWIPTARAESLIHFDKLLSEHAVEHCFQPIVSIADGHTLAYELLTRGRLEGLETAAAMFATAGLCNMEVELSTMMRTEGAKAGRSLPGSPNLFVNTHPKEIGTLTLSDSLAELRGLVGDQPITVEIHEATITDAQEMRRLMSVLDDLNMRLAYDDFGAGQARLAELVDAPPDYLKFDINLIHDIHRASPRRRKMMESLVRMIRDLEISTIAEGIECREEAEVCRDVGFEYAQGYWYGRPVPVGDGSFKK